MLLRNNIYIYKKKPTNGDNQYSLRHCKIVNRV